MNREVGMNGWGRSLDREEETREEETRDVRGESALVHAVVDIVVDPLVHGLDFRLQRGREEIDRGELLRELVVESGVEHAYYLAALVADDLVRFLVVQRRHREAPTVVRVLFEIDVPDVREVLVQRVRGRELARDLLVWFGEAPAWV